MPHSSWSAVENWPNIEFVNDADACLFTAIVRRKASEGSDPAESEVSRSDPIKDHSALLSGHAKNSDPINDFINLLKSRPTAEYASLAQTLSVSEATIKRHLQRLKREGRVRRVGSKKSGYWEILL